MYSCEKNVSLVQTIINNLPHDYTGTMKLKLDVIQNTTWLTLVKE